MTTATRNIAIGVGVGVGVGVQLGVLAVFGYRMWGRRRLPADEDNYLMNDGYAEKPQSPDASPFKSTLDQYHNPAGRMNTAANF